MRVVSLLPSATEIVAALGCADRLVGRSHECDFPAGIERLPALTAPRLKLEGKSADIDRRVKEVLSKALSVYSVDADRLYTLAPDLIVTQSQCEVCAVSESDVVAATRDWIGRPVDIVSLAAVDLAGVWADVRRVAASLALPVAGEAVVRQAEARIATIASMTDGRDRPSVACIEWLDPLMAAGNWMPELAQLAGGNNSFGEAGKHSPWMQWDDLIDADPEVIVVLPCGFDLGRNKAEVGTLTRDPRWLRLRAVRSGRVYLTDGNQFFNRPGTRLTESLEILAELLHPDAFDFGHRGAAWEPLAT
jgi:iron complex transport system substrate-binding protein